MASSQNTDKLAICMLVPNIYPLPMGGYETQALRLSEHLIKTGVSVFILAQGKPGADRHSVVLGVPVFRVCSALNQFSFLSRRKKISNTIIDFSGQATSYLQNINTRPKFKDLLGALFYCFGCYRFLSKNRGRFNVIHVHTMQWISLVGAFLGKVFNVPVVIKDSSMNGIHQIRQIICGKYIESYIINNYYFVAMTKTIEDNFTYVGIPDRRIFRIPNGLDLKAIKNKAYYDRFNCLFVGNLTQEPAKGVDILLRAWINIANKYPEARLTIVGDGNIDAYYIFAEELGIKDSVIFTGRVQNTEDYYLKAGIFVLPSRREGLSNALLEAMAYSLPIVATKISGNIDLIQNCETGFLVNVDNINELSSAIIDMMENYDKARKMGAKARLTVEHVCSIETVTEKYIHMYNDILPNKPLDDQP